MLAIRECKSHLARMATFRWSKLVPSRDLCGASPEEFAQLIERLAPVWEQRRRELENFPGRKRAPGAGMKPTPFWVQLFATMTMWRQGLTVRAAGEVFGVHERTIRRWRDAIEDVLFAHGFQHAGAAEPIRSVDDLVGCVQANDVDRVAVDGTETRRSQLTDYRAQKAAYSGKTKATWSERAWSPTITVGRCVPPGTLRARGAPMTSGCCAPRPNCSLPRRRR